MTWWKTAAYWGLAACLFAYYLAFEGEPPAAEQTKSRMEIVLPIFTDEVKGLTLRTEGREIRTERPEKRWRVVRPEERAVPSDLFTALLDSLTKSQKSEVVSASPSQEEVEGFGLAAPAWTLEVEGKDGKKTIVQFGDRNPPTTAVYARIEGSPKVFLVGLNVQYYGDLIFEAAYPRGSGAAETTTAS